MKVVLIFVALCILKATANDAPGFFLKTTKNIPRLGKRTNAFPQLGGKNVPRLGRRGGPSIEEELKFYNHVQPFDSKFILDFLSNELFIGEGDLKFLSWDDLDRALESDSALKEKLTSIARDNEVEELKKVAHQMNRADTDDNEVVQYGDPISNKIYQKFIPVAGSRDFKYNNRQNDAYYYYSNDVKRSGKTDRLNKEYQ